MHGRPDMTRVNVTEFTSSLFETRDPWKLYRLLKENGITYVAFDGAVRQASFIKRPNEQVYATYFPKVFEDKQNRYNSLIIYKIPDTPPVNLSSVPEGVTNMFDGGRGNDKGDLTVRRELLLILKETFWSPIQTTLESKNFHRLAAFSAVWESRESAMDS